MAQIQTGTAAVLNGSEIVTASAGNDWSNAIINGQFTITGIAAVLYTISDVRAPGDNVSGRWELSLSAPYAGADNAVAPYTIAIDFTPGLGLALLRRGDVETALLVNRSLAILEERILALES